MAADAKSGPPAAAPDHRPAEAAIGKHVLLTLGRPNDLRQVNVKRLWENHYRVNVVTGPEPGLIARSYFLVTDGDGTIVEATPPITRQF